MPHEQVSMYATDMHLAGTTCSGAIAEEDFIVKQEDVTIGISITV